MCPFVSMVSFVVSRRRYVELTIALPDETETELHVAPVAGGRDGADRDVRDVEVRRSEVRAIQQIEHLPAEFEPRLVDGEALAQGEVHLLRSRPPNRVAACRALGADGRNLIGGRIEPA